MKQPYPNLFTVAFCKSASCLVSTSNLNYEQLSALYSKENLKLMREMRWLSRVPFSIKEAQELVDSISEKAQGVTEQLKSLLYKAHSR
jgi:DNA-binding transcriptional MerR regulator